MTAANLHHADNRVAMYKRLARRNALVALLRIGVPFFGVLLLLFLIIQIMIANVTEQYGVSGVILERDALVIETPSYSGTMANGTEYSVTADKATALLSNTSVLDLTNAVLELVRPGGANHQRAGRDDGQRFTWHYRAAAPIVYRLERADTNSQWRC
jgi:lipopolysaccharide export system protein LptC